MNFVVCKNCGTLPQLVNTEGLGMMYQLICPKCGNETSEITSSSSTLLNQHCDAPSLKRLSEMWNEMNKPVI